MKLGPPWQRPHCSCMQQYVTTRLRRFWQLRLQDFFLVPKIVDSRISFDWKAAWADGSRAHLIPLSTQTKGCAGLVRLTKSIGLRFAKADFKQAWQIIHPSKPDP